MAASLQNSIILCKSLVAGTPCWPNSWAMPSASYQRCTATRLGWQIVATTGSRRLVSFSFSVVRCICLFLTTHLLFFNSLQAVCYLDEYNEMLDFIVRWSEKAKSLLRANIIWNSSVHLQEQIRMYQVSFRSKLTCVKYNAS